MSGPCSAGYFCSSEASTPTPQDATTGDVCPKGRYCPQGSQQGEPCPRGAWYFNILKWLQDI